jgi:hypothetical protein
LTAEIPATRELPRRGPSFGEPRTRRTAVLLGGLGLAALVGCFDGNFLRLEQCTKESDCGRGQDCVDGLCIECSGDLCSPYVCPVAEIDGVCPCPGRAKFECQELASVGTNKVDILFVVDNSGPTLQSRLLDTTQPLLESLDARLVDYRIAMTTTDMGNPACPDEATTPAQGDFVLESCLARLDDFEADGVDATEDCLERCSHETIETPHPWLEVSPAGTNFGIPIAEALACTLQPGINGCGFEAPLESLYQALTKAEMTSEANSGFIREDAHLLVVIFTDQADCSYNSVYENIFEPDGGQVFWSGNLEPTQAICWNAGVECIGGPDPYYDCIAVDKDSDGVPTHDESAAVLHPVERYISQLRELEEKKQAELATLEVVVTVIAGVPEGYDDEAIVYEWSGMGDEFEEQFGIAPGCQSESTNDDILVEAVPPVRMLKFADAVRGSSESNNIYSVCASGLGRPFDGIAEALDTSFPPLCMPICVEEPANCELATFEDGATVEIPQCETDADGNPSRGSEELCFFTRVGDQVAPECRDLGSNVQFGFLHATGREVPEQLYASCEPATNSTACPTLR